jgi:O-antigen ligase
MRSVLAARHDNRYIILRGLSVAATTIALYAVYQKFTGFGINEPRWVNPDHRRVTSFFTSPNAVGLFLAPVMMITTGWLLATWRQWRGAIVKLLLVGLYGAAIFFTVSQGTWIGVAAGLATLLFFGWNKYITSGLMIAALAVAILTPTIRQTIAPYALFKDVAGQNRIELWDLSLDTLTEGPTNFTLGIGIFGFAKLHNDIRDPLHIEPLLYPHNIVLNFWLEYGLPGLFAIGWLLIAFSKQCRKQLRPNNLQPKTDRWFVAGLLAAVITMLVHGLVDVPYFKNDLAVLWWVVLGLVI